MQIELWTDGACKGNPGVGGWAALLVALDDNGVPIDRQNRANPYLIGGSHPDTTNNRMELTAVIRGLELLTKPTALTVYTDSQYVIQRAERSSNKRANLDLWGLYNAVAVHHDITFQWVEGHAGVAYNERVDAEASRQALLASVRVGTEGLRLI